MIYKAFDIQYDTDGEDIEDLPQELYFHVDEDDGEDAEEVICDGISDRTGWCHFGFNFEPVSLTFSYGSTPDEIIRMATNIQCPDGYPMTIRSQDQWSWIAAAVNMGIDAHLEAFTQSTFDHTTGQCLIHPNEMHILLRRLEQVDADYEDDEDVIEGRADHPGSLRQDILTTLDIEEI